MAHVQDREDLSAFVLSAFGDEIDDDVDTQLDVLGGLGIRYLEMRTAWGKKAADLGDREVERLAAACRKRSIRVSCIGSRIGKSPIAEPLEATLAELGRILESGRASGHETGADLLVPCGLADPEAMGTGQSIKGARINPHLKELRSRYVRNTHASLSIAGQQFRRITAPG